MTRLRRLHAVLFAFAVGTGAVAATAADTSLPRGAIQVPAGSGQWIKGPPSLPPGTEVMRLEGDSGKAGMFTIRLKVPAGTKLQPHWHPRDERVTVLSGEVLVGFGDVFDERGMTRFGPGSFYVNPSRSHHYLIFPVESVMQITGEGPWELHYSEAP